MFICHNHYDVVLGQNQQQLKNNMNKKNIRIQKRKDVAKNYNNIMCIYLAAFACYSLLCSLLTTQISYLFSTRDKTTIEAMRQTSKVRNECEKYGIEIKNYWH